MRSLLLLLTLCSVCFGQSVSVTGPTQAETNQVVFLDSTNTVGDYRKWITPEDATTLVGKNGIALVFSSAGTKTITLVASSKDGIAAGTHTITISGQPTPGPGPTPTPDPPPGPTPVAPIPVPGFRVLMVCDFALGVPDAFTAKSVRDYLNRKCIADAVSKTPEYRVWDNFLDVSSASIIWKNAMARKRDSIPWIIISDGKTGFEGPAPTKPDELLALLKKYGGE